MTFNPMVNFSNDGPLSDKQYDRLNRAPFASRIAEVLCGLPKGTSLVVGIHGPWGDGKTTVLNFVRTELETKTRVIAVEFNPWRFTDESVMLAEFFGLLAGTIRTKLATKGEEIAGWLEKISRYAAVLNYRFDNAAALAASKAEAGLDELRDRLSGALNEADKRIVVLIDDIDRLDKHETYTLFRIIKACADFPNVCYVLAFDDAAVALALGERYSGGAEASGRAFLQKIIQVPLKLPAAAKEDLRSLCFEEVNSALTAAGIELTKEQIGEFISGFDRGVSVRLTTPRAVKRYGNGLKFALPMLKGETNAVDLLLVEALRAFFPEVYDVVRDNHPDFSGVEPDRRVRGDSGPRAAELLKPLLEPMPKDQADAVRALLIDLFPRLSGVYRNIDYRSDWLSRWSREQRISAPGYCPRYFAYAVPNNDVPDAEVLGLLDAANQANAAGVEERLTIHLAGPRARRLIEKLRAIETTVDPNAAQMLAINIVRLGQNVPNPPELFSTGPASQAAILISHLLSRIPDRAKRTIVAKDVVQAANPLWFGAECVRWLYVTDKPEKQDSNILTEAEISEVRQVLVDRIKSRSATGSALFDPDIPQEKSLLFEWWRTEGRDPVQAHLVGLFAKDPQQVPRFLQALAPLAWSEGAVLPRIGELDASVLTNMNLIVDLDTMAGWVRKHCPGNFDNPEWFPDDTKPLGQRLAEQFMFVYNKRKKDGDSPDSQSDHDDGSGNKQPDGDVVGERTS